MSNLSTKIIVICDSDIILKGLTEFLNLCNSDEVFQLNHPNELIDYPHLSGYILLIIPNKLFIENERYIKRSFSNANEIKHLFLNFDEDSISLSNSINIFDNSSLIVSKVNEILISFGSKNVNKLASELSPREIDVLQLVAKGLANKEVADKLSISTHTVISHRKNISEKTGIKSASGLTMYAVLKKIIDISEISTSDLI